MKIAEFSPVEWNYPGPDPILVTVLYGSFIFVLSFVDGYHFFEFMTAIFVGMALLLAYMLVSVHIAERLFNRVGRSSKTRKGAD